MATDTLKQIGNQVCTDFLGFEPTSNATKPPHIANGLFRNVSGETCNTKDIHEWIVSERRKDAISSEEIIKKYQDVLQEGYLTKTSDVKQLRFLLEEIFNQDNTVYPSYEFSVMTISSHWMLKKKLNPEAGIGDFLFQILSKKIDGKRSGAIELINRALMEDSDDMSKIVKPIIGFPTEAEKCNKDVVDYPDERDIIWDEYKQKIRNGFDCLAENMVESGESNNSLAVLKRIVNYSMFATYFYLANCNAAKFNGEATPILCDAGEWDSVKKASEQTFVAAKKAVELFYINAIKQILQNEISKNTVAACNKWISGIVADSAEKADEIKKAIQDYFDSYQQKDTEPIDALSKAVQIALYTLCYKNNSPSDFCRVLGVRGGLLAPKGNRAKNKRFLLNSYTLETITLSAVDKNDFISGIDLKSLCIKLFESYKLMIGENAENEYKLLQDLNIAQSTPGDLRGDLSLNANYISNIYISLGMAKRYADGVTMIGWRL